MLHSLMWTHKRHDGHGQFDWVENVIHSDNRWTLYCLYLTLRETPQAKDGDLGPFCCRVFGQYYNDVVMLNESPQALNINPLSVTH